MRMRFSIFILLLIVIAINTNSQDEKQIKLNSQFLAAVEKSNLTKTEALLAKGADVNAVNDEKETALIISLLNKNEEIAKFLINKGASINVSDNDGWTPLLCALFKNLKETVRILIDNGAELNVKDKLGETPLMTAIDYSEPEIVNLLLEKGADIVARDNKGLTPLCHAYAFSTPNIIKIISEKDEDINLYQQKAEEPFSIDYIEFDEKSDGSKTDLTISKTSFGLFLQEVVNNINKGEEVSGKWGIGAKHIWRGILKYCDYSFYSNPNDELQFEVTKDNGYKYIKGCGVIIEPDNSIVLLKDKKIEGYIPGNKELVKIYGKLEDITYGRHMVCILEPHNDNAKKFNPDFCAVINDNGEFEIISTADNLSSEFTDKDDLFAGVVTGGATLLYQRVGNSLIGTGLYLVNTQYYIKLVSDKYPSATFSSGIFKDPVTDIGILRAAE
jgi:hypothetical protein